MDWKTADFALITAHAVKGMEFDDGGANGEATLWEIDSGTCVSRMACDMYKMDTAAFSQDGRLVAMAPRGGHVEIWDVMTGNRVLELHAGQRAIDGHSQYIESVAFSPRGQMLAMLTTAPPDR